MSWQKVAIREYVPLEIIDDTSFPDQVPVSREFRFFYFNGVCVGYGPYWYMGQSYQMNNWDIDAALELADWASKKMAAPFVAIDFAKTAAGDWIIIEVNDAQESGFVGLNPIALWNSIIDTAQEKM